MKSDKEVVDNSVKILRQAGYMKATGESLETTLKFIIDSLAEERRRNEILSKETEWRVLEEVPPFSPK